MRYNQTVGVALVSASAFLFPELKQVLQAMVRERRAITEERKARAGMAQFELGKKCSQDTGS